MDPIFEQHLPQTRRQFFAGSGLRLGGVVLAMLAGKTVAPPCRAGEVLFPRTGVPKARHLVGQQTPGRQPSPPEGKSVPFGWSAVAIGSDADTRLELRWPREAEADDRPTGLPARLRVTVALDEQEIKTLAAASLGSGESVGAFDIRFAFSLQTFEMPLTPAQAQTAMQDGLALRLTTGSPPLWVFSRSPNVELRKAQPSIPDALLPHLLFDEETDRRAELFRRLESLDSIQPFGWIEGCVLDGLWARRSRRENQAELSQAIWRRLKMYFSETPPFLSYESSRSNPLQGSLHGIEATLPFACLARMQPDHPAVDLALRHWQKWSDAEGAILDGNTITAEGCYTVAYPLAVVARQRKLPKLEEQALVQLRVRRERLFDGESLYLRHHRSPQGNVARSYRNWARGCAWYMLGMAQTMAELKHRTDLDEHLQGLRRAAAWAIRHQQSDGLWPVYLDQPQLASDTSGSAGLAAALAIGVREGWLDADALTAARRTAAALTERLTPDGQLGGAAQSNKGVGGEALQRSDYRVLLGPAQGMTALLLCVLEQIERV